ncbi:MAG: VCBS repeat-containing protein [Rhodothermales bacterium]|nr:VCBS repeat-containing protein [Rhodothermales bacterium]
MKHSIGVLLLLLVCMGAGCALRLPAALPEAATGPQDSAAPEFERDVFAFEVRDGAGRLYGHPFLGGLNVPRPQFVDIDGDGDDDLFLQNITGQMMFFERIGTHQNPEWRWQTDRYMDLDIGEWSRFVDIDADGDFDILAERPFSYMQLYHNTGSSERAVFAANSDTVRSATGAPIFADRQNIPNFTDIDCDGLLDLFIGRVEGTVMHYESTGPPNAPLPQFGLVAERFENIEIIGQFAGSRHGANTMAFHDYDGDGDQDLFWGDFFEPGVLFIENTGTCAQPYLRNDPQPFPIGNPLITTGYNAPAFTDWDSDGDNDLVVGVLGGAFNPNRTAAENLILMERTAEGGYVIRDRRFIAGIDVGLESIPAFVDRDGDGDQDMIVTNKIDPSTVEKALAYYFENTGSPTHPAFQLADTLDLPAIYHPAPAFADLDADGDQDLLLGTWFQGMQIHWNTGTAQTPNYVHDELATVTLSRGSNSTPALADLDNDGDFDLMAGEASGTINFYRNDGTPQKPAFTLVSDEFMEIDGGRRSFPALVDIEGDGDYDLLVGREKGELMLFRNVGTPEVMEFTAEPELLPLPMPALATPAFVDIDGDGDLDLFVGGDSGGILFYRNR